MVLSFSSVASFWIILRNENQKKTLPSSNEGAWDNHAHEDKPLLGMCFDFLITDRFALICHTYFPSAPLHLQHVYLN